MGDSGWVFRLLSVNWGPAVTEEVSSKGAGEQTLVSRLGNGTLPKDQGRD